METFTSLPETPSIPATPPLPPAAPVVPPPHRPHTALFVVLFLLALGAALYFFYQMRTLQSELAASPSPTPAASVSTAADPTADWKTYTNTEYGYSFKYPSTLSLSTAPNGKNSNADVNTSSYVFFPKLLYFNHSFNGGKIIPAKLGFSDTEVIGTNTFAKAAYPKGDGPDSTPFVRYLISSPTDSTQGIVIDARGSAPISELQRQILSTFQFTSSPSSTKKFGYIRKLIPNNNTYSLNLDYAEFIQDSTAPNGYRIENSYPDTQTLSANSQTKVVLQTYSHGADGNFNYNQALTFVDFVKAYNSKESVKAAPYQFEIQNANIISITEQYIP